MTWTLNPDRYFSPEPTRRRLARTLYQAVKDLPIVSPHGHVDPRLFADPAATLGSPAELLIIPDHYVFRMLYSQGVPLEQLGVPRIDGGATETDHRKIWQLFCEHYHLFQGTPSGGWIDHELVEILGVTEKPGAANAQRLYDHISERLTAPAFRPRALLDSLNIEILCTTDAAADDLVPLQTARQDPVGRRIFPTYRPDALLNLHDPAWPVELARLEQASAMRIDSFSTFLEALWQRRVFFKQLGAHAADHGVLTAATEHLSQAERERIFQRALGQSAEPSDTARFTAHMLIEFARMSVEDGLVMQLHAGAYRNHNPHILHRFGRDKGFDIPIPVEFTRPLLRLLEAYGNDPRLTLILFSVDEDPYSRELSTLAGAYPAVKLGPPWWFHDSPNGMLRYFDQVMETAGLYNTAGFNDDTRAFLSIPARHDVWRRVACDWLAGMVLAGRMDETDGASLARLLAYDLAKIAYRFEGAPHA
ncbi:MAG: glucuronate isomerase [Anaerolineae bacterium]|nr:glucuronate isomerase [Anaerolineae bacterium]